MVTRVYDGDTFDIRGKHGERLRIRVWGLDAPEHGQIGVRAAKKRLEELLAAPGWRFQRQDGDRYGRHVCKVLTASGQRVEELLISEGLAWWYKQFVPWELRLKGLQREAQEARRGIWAQAEAMPPWAFRRGRRKRG